MCSANWSLLIIKVVIAVSFRGFIWAIMYACPMIADSVDVFIVERPKMKNGLQMPLCFFAYCPSTICVGKHDIPHLAKVCYLSSDNINSACRYCALLLRPYRHTRVC